MKHQESYALHPPPRKRQMEPPRTHAPDALTSLPADDIQSLEIHPMRVQEIMHTQVSSCGPEDSLEHAAQLMWENDCGALPVCAGDGINRVIGMITDRDIAMNALFQHQMLKDLKVKDAMSKSVETCRSSDSVSQAEKIMREARIRRLPVLDGSGSLAGIVSLADLAREASRERMRDHKDVTETEICSTLAAIVKPPKEALAA